MLFGPSDGPPHGGDYKGGGGGVTLLQDPFSNSVPNAELHFVHSVAPTQSSILFWLYLGAVATQVEGKRFTQGVGWGLLEPLFQTPPPSVTGTPKQAHGGEVAGRGGGRGRGS